MVAIMATGNYTFFNVLTLALTLSLLDARGGLRKGERDPSLHQNAAANADFSADDARPANKGNQRRLPWDMHRDLSTQRWRHKLVAQPRETIFCPPTIDSKVILPAPLHPITNT